MNPYGHHGVDAVAGYGVGLHRLLRGLSTRARRYSSKITGYDCFTHCQHQALVLALHTVISHPNQPGTWSAVRAPMPHSSFIAADERMAAASNTLATGRAVEA